MIWGHGELARFRLVRVFWVNSASENVRFLCQATFKGWMDIMYAAVDSRKVTHQTSNSPPSYFCLLFCFGKIKRRSCRTVLVAFISWCDCFVCSGGLMS